MGDPQTSGDGDRLGASPPMASRPAGFEKRDIEQSIPERFAQQVRRYAEKIAVKDDTTALTYRDLNEASNRVARIILSHQEREGESVALLLDHEAPTITAIIGTLKAGKAYVPLDPQYPSKRIGYMLNDSQARLILTNTKNLPLALRLAQNAVQVINIDQIEGTAPGDDIRLPITPDALAYIKYSSGSTGQPKGIVHNHRNVLHHLWDNATLYRLTAMDRHAHLFSCSFAASISEVLGALLNGATLCLYDIKRAGLSHFASWLLREEITVLKPPISFFRLFMRTLEGENHFPKLRLVLLGGDTLYARDVDLFRERLCSHCILTYRLASTETNTLTHFIIDINTKITTGVVPIGHAARDKYIAIVDEAGRPVASDQVGEITVRSRYITPGYWRRQDLTEKAFSDPPEGHKERVYHTGDLGRMRPDGLLEHLGRKGSLVKIRGYRVEMTEITAALRALDPVGDAVVGTREDPSGEKALVAYVVPAGPSGPTGAELRDALAGSLPDYMIPSTFVFLESVPTTATGKIDLQALPSCDAVPIAPDRPYQAPRTPVEEVLTEIWKDVLGLDSLGIYDDFVDLGGNSLMAFQVNSRVFESFQLELPTASLFETSTIAELAVIVTQHLAKRATPGDIDQMLDDLEGLSDEEVGRRLAAERTPKV